MLFRREDARLGVTDYSVVQPRCWRKIGSVFLPVSLRPERTPGLVPLHRSSVAIVAPVTDSRRVGRKPNVCSNGSTGEEGWQGGCVVGAYQKAVYGLQGVASPHLASSSQEGTVIHPS